VPPHLALVPVRPVGPRRVALLGELRSGADAIRSFDERSVVDPCAGTAMVGAVHERCADLLIDLDAHGSVQSDGALVVTVALQVRHVLAQDGAQGLEAETTVVDADLPTPFALVCRDGHGCRASASGSITNRPMDDAE
jgi:hypothetical protein